MAALAPISLASLEPRTFAAALGASFARYGFAIVSDHGIRMAQVQRVYDRAKSFFALPEDIKRRYHVPGTGGARGFTPFGIEAAKDADAVDLKEFWHTGRELAEGHRYRAMMPANLWPAEIEGFREAVLELFDALDHTGRRILEGVAIHLGLAPDFFDAPTAEGNSVLRLLHYPPVPPEAQGVRAGAHEDINVITLLLGAEEAGLELLDREGRWVPVNPPPGALAVNVGDMLQRLTNHVLPSTTHRVVNPDAGRAGIARYSIPYFLHFAPDFPIRTLRSCVGPGNPDRYPEPITADAYLQQRLREIRLL